MKLVVHPQRTVASVVFVAVGAACIVGAVAGAIVAGKLWGAVCLAAFGALFLGTGLHSWRTTVVFTRQRNQITMQLHHGRHPPTVHTFLLSSVVSVDIEEDDGAGKLVVVTTDARIPLTGSSITGNHERKARPIRVFLELPVDAAAPPTARLLPPRDAD
jgi:hypothetical protein